MQEQKETCRPIYREKNDTTLLAHVILHRLGQFVEGSGHLVAAKDSNKNFEYSMTTTSLSHRGGDPTTTLMTDHVIVGSHI